MIILSLAIIFFIVEKNLQKRLNLKIKKLVLRKEIQGDSLQFRNMKLHELCEKVYEWVTEEKKDERYVFHNIGFSSGKKILIKSL